MRKSHEAGFGHWVVFLLGAVMVLFLIGFFRTDQHIGEVAYKKILRLPCGLTFDSVKENDKISFPLKLEGYINECGWIKKGSVAGTAQVFDGTGAPVSNKANLNIAPYDSEYPYYFENSLVLENPPHTDTGSLIINGVGGLWKAIPVSFLR